MAAIFSLVLSLLLPVSANAQAASRLDVPYVPTSTEVVNGMLNLAKVNNEDPVYDLGRGDGRIVVTAARL